MNACLHVADLIAVKSDGPARVDTGLDARLSLAMFDAIAIGLVVCDGGGCIRFSNHAARLELTAARLLLRSGNRLCRSPAAHGELEVALRLAAQRGRRGLVSLSAGPDRLMASVLPLELAGEAERHVLVVLGRRQACDELGLELLAANFGLTLAERRVLGALLQDATPREIAADHDVALSTIRSQISSLREKMGARSVESLLLQAAVVPPVAGALRSTVEATPTPFRLPEVGLLAARHAQNGRRSQAPTSCGLAG